jgi:hypothetical protein
MTENPSADPETAAEAAADAERVDTRAELLPEEEAAGGSDAPVDQAQAILEESDERTEDPEGTRSDSTQTPDLPGQDARPQP